MIVLYHRGKGGGLIGYSREKALFNKPFKKQTYYSCNSTITKNNTIN
jgi:hypothetical protein